MPVTAFYCKFLLPLAQAHTGLQTMVDTRCVSDDERWSIVSLSLLDDVHVLNRACTHSHLGYIDITIGHCHHSEVLLADFLS